MSDYITAENKIEEEYNRCREGETDRKEVLYALLYPYLKGYLQSRFGTGFFGSREMVEDVVQDCMKSLIAADLGAYRPEGAKFAKWCCVMAKNRMIDHIRKYRRVEPGGIDEELTGGMDTAGFVGDIDQFKDPQKILIDLEYKLEQCERLKKALQLLITAKVEPYQTVGNCFTLILFHKYNPGSKRNSSPKWGYEQLEDSSVEDGADRFMEEMHGWMPHIPLAYDSGFTDRMDEMKDGEYIGRMIFGEHFKEKDFENWSSRARKSICSRMVERDMVSDLELR